jgi:hypothetical protein
MKAKKQIMNHEAFLFDAVTPCPEPVQPAALLAEIEAVIKKHVVLPEHAAAALAVWVLHTYTFNSRDAVAYVLIESPEKRCGKTTLLAVLAAMAHKPLIASNITVSALFRAIDTCRPTLFIDEADTFLAGNSAMRGIINSGNTWRTAYVLRLARGKYNRAPLNDPPGLPAGDESAGNPGGETGLNRFSCWCPKVIALIGHAPDTIADRSIVVKMTRKLTTETCAPLNELKPAEIKAKCARFALDAGPAIASHEKIRGAGLNDRAADTFDPLYVIARQAGGDWEAKLHAAALALTAAADSDNAAAELLLDIFFIFLDTGCEKIFSRELAGLLRDGGGGMRSLALRGSALDEFALAKILRPYGIKPATFRIGQEVNKGYARVDFHEALRRYVPRLEIEARMKDMDHRSQLCAEASAEMEKERALREQARAAEPQKSPVPDLSEALANLRQLV